MDIRKLLKFLTLYDNTTYIDLFVYGKLEPQHEHPDTMKNPHVDFAYGDLYDTGTDAAAVNIGKSRDLFRGYRMRILRSELKQIDKIEMPEYRRIQTTTKAGYKVWIYEYEKPIKPSFKKIFFWT